MTADHLRTIRRTAEAGTREILTAVEAARYLRIGDGRLLALIRSGEIPAADVSPRPGSSPARWRVRRADLDAWLASRQYRPPVKRQRTRKPERPPGWIEYV